ncbi:helix-turn-helix transcriptional regulator [Stackebrandtia nassauensis]|uniref:Transcriptional regulator, LuxR family n=1 Tax=Stackebrandtia nassauensis (strain DSM 44728 / CIP 108903 / NRRL B-16338 / NBRC 102104 / LLR-40K-21) TaxID=446470 RepID=D3PVF4_STANL|nr:LuxR C-terminal-related transcriptional regulator [Stackebrandtia nassauensis]ADD43068.1 transcriptional regulator, LuxR family [Stackebrandtia nassauensis DSM 44728]
MTTPDQPLAAVFTVLNGPLDQLLGRFSALLRDLVPHEALAMLTGDCSRNPLITHGDPAVAERVVTAELNQLGAVTGVTRPWWGQAKLAGRTRPVLAVASHPRGSAGALLAVAAHEPRPSTEVLATVQSMWDLITLHVADRAGDVESPQLVMTHRLVAEERARVVTELTESHSATIVSLLAALRSRTLSDTAARQVATDLAVNALIDLRTTGDWDRVISQEVAEDAFTRLADRLRPLSRYGDVELELVPPSQSQRELPGQVARVARTMSRAVVLVLLEQGGVGRVRITWDAGDAALRITIRDDGSGHVPRRALESLRTNDRLGPLSGTFTVDAVPGWGTAVTITVPLAVPSATRPAPLPELNPRELDVLAKLAGGLRNRRIAEELHISENTVKFHVGNILQKLGVASRNEAAVLARDAGIDAATVSAG